VVLVVVVLVVVVLVVVVLVVVVVVLVVVLVVVVVRLASEDDQNICVTNKCDEIRVKISTERRCTLLNENYPSKQASWTFYLVRANCAKFGLHTDGRIFVEIICK
jgi:cell division protein YceG involved in septum cleavage